MGVDRYDGIVIGAGQNGLTTAAYLAKAGLKVAVFERRPHLGGAFSTDELTVPGFRHNIHALYTRLHDGPVYSDLGLDRYGVEFVFPDPRRAFVRHDSCFVYGLSVEATCDSIRRFSPKDAETFRRIAPLWRRWYLDFILPEMYAAPRPPDQWEAEIRAKPGGAEYIEVARNRSAAQYAIELFESDFCRSTVMGAAALADFDVMEKGIPALVFSTLVSWVVGKTSFIRGGTRRYAEALARIVGENGGAVITGNPVARIIVENGAAKGVSLMDGSEVRAARFVASSIDPVHTFLFMVGEELLPADVSEKVAAYQFNDTSLFRVHLALKERPHFTVSRLDPMVNDAAIYTLGFEGPGDFGKLLAQARSGLIPEILGLGAGITTLSDPSQAPPGRHVAHIGLPMPFDLADGGSARWVDVARDTADRMIVKLREYAPNMTDDNILGRFIYTPKDIEEYLPNMVNGDICQGKICVGQLGWNRPWAGMSRYRTFIDGLYLCGASTHPGGHAIAACGYNAANIIAEELGVPKWWRPYDPRAIVVY